jgi:hypothetical protein
MAINWATLQPAQTDLVGRVETNVRKLAREIAIGILNPDQILKLHGLTEAQWHELAASRAFQELLGEEMQLWQSGLNTKQRVELKTWAMLEEALPTLWNMLHDKDFNDAAKVSLVSALQKQVGIGQKDVQQNGSADSRISITINTGTEQVKVEREVTPQVIEGEVVNAA